MTKEEALKTLKASPEHYNPQISALTILVVGLYEGKKSKKKKKK